MAADVPAAPVGTKPAPFTLPDIHALKALWAGTATQDQQQRAIHWIVDGACGFTTDPFSRDARTTDYLVGRQSVARQILALVNAKPKPKGV